jgi:hypothetical protein
VDPNVKPVFQKQNFANLALETFDSTSCIFEIGAWISFSRTNAKTVSNINEVLNKHGVISIKHTHKMSKDE